MTITQMSAKSLKETASRGGMTIFGSKAEGTYRPFDQWDGFDWKNDPDNVVWLSQQKPGDFLNADCTPAELWLDIFGYGHPKSIMFAEGAFFAVHRDTIRLRPLTIYKRILGKFMTLNHINPEIGHFIEKFWGEIFIDAS
ncbi:hypothetical protein BDV23DRAFT_178960 [Aspergillus alliaceus]|uniref:Uncharacterized protein n=1 Tax=Petromyces alliaceus TaxID=209559 RepID=A0A5N7CL65_PETAA|nr:hypothetical protein BDV23DRAFT_178960 [Aspergillus alliaceus]